MSQSGTRPQIEESPQPMVDDPVEDESFSPEARAKAIAHFRFLWEKRGFLGKAFGIGLLVGLAIAFAIPARYDAMVQLMPPDGQSSTGAMMLAAITAKAGASNLGGLAGDLLGVKSSGALFVGVLGSRTVQDRIIQRFDLKKVYGYKLDVDARKKLASRTNLAEDRKSGIIAISVTDHDPQRAAEIAGAYVEELNQLTAELSTSGAHRERVFLEERLNAVKKDLNDASVKFSQFASKNAAIDIKEQGRAMMEAAARLQGEKIAAESELKGLEQIYMPGNVRVRAAQARISELQNQLEKLGGQAGGAPQTSGSSAALYPSIRELPVLGVTWADLYRQTKIQETVYEVLTEQYELAKVEEAKETPSVKVLDAPRVPERKSFPPRGPITLFVGFVFLAAAGIALFLRAQWDGTDATDAGKLFAQEVFQSLNQHMPWATSGSGIQAITHKTWERVAAGRGGAKPPESGSKLP